MRVGVISDTHGDRAILREAVLSAGSVGHWLHAGDIYKDAIFLAQISDAPVTAVAGNCDLGGGPFPEEERLAINGVNIWLTHGHRHNVKRTIQDLIWRGRQCGAAIVVFGHTHLPYKAWHDGALLFNPGSLRYPRGEWPTFGVIDLGEGKNITAEIIKVE